MSDLQGVSLDNTATVETPERIRFLYHVAGPVRRALAYLIDLVIRGVVVVLAALLIHGPVDTGAVRASWGGWLLVVFVIEWGWNVLFESAWSGRTIGKRALGLRVVREGGYPLGFIDAVLRNLLRAADFLPVGYVLGLLVMAGDRRFRRLGDMVAGTMVVLETDAAATTAPLVAATPPTPGELGALPARPRVSAQEVEAIELFLRRPHLSPERRLELAQLVTPTLARRLGVAGGDPVRFLAALHRRMTDARHPVAAPAVHATPPTPPPAR